MKAPVTAGTAAYCWRSCGWAYCWLPVLLPVLLAVLLLVGRLPAAVAAG